MYGSIYSSERGRGVSAEAFTSAALVLWTNQSTALLATFSASGRMFVYHRANMEIEVVRCTL